MVVELRTIHGRLLCVFVGRKNLWVGEYMNTVIKVRRPKSHPKGEKIIAVIEYGKPVPPGVIIGKGSIITVELVKDVNLVKAAQGVLPGDFF